MNEKSRQISAVALSFNPDSNRAPEIIAKGEGVFAEKIIELARHHGKEIVNDAELLKLLQTIPAGKEIPETLYRAIAVIYSYFYKLNSEARRT